MEKLSDRLYNWASEIDQVTKNQAFVTSSLPIIEGHLALMPDAHLGIGATIGSVIPTKSAIIPSAVGVDLGCGMIARRTSLHAPDLPDDLAGVLDAIMRAVPAGVGKGHQESSAAADRWMAEHPNPALTTEQNAKALMQFGSLGGGNHFFEVCLDQEDGVWIIMHSGSRGVGNQLANSHIKVAKTLGVVPKEDRELAYFQENTPQFDAYIRDMRWSQEYAMANRTAMMAAATYSVYDALRLDHSKFPVGAFVQETINCHHNFAQKERHGDQDVWITRKGAIKADVGDLGLIPGSMGGKSYVVSGLGNTDSYTSCAHGAGRRMSRTKAKETFDTDEFAQKMAGVEWQKGSAKELLDEHPGSYKDIDAVMEDQKDLVKILYELKAVVNYKGTS